MFEVRPVDKNLSPRKMQFRVPFTALLGIILCSVYGANSQDILGCGGFVKSEVEINFSMVEVSPFFAPQNQEKAWHL